MAHEFIARTGIIALAGSTFTTLNATGSISLNGTNLNSLYQPIDADLSAIAALPGTTGLLKKTAADTWTLDTTSYISTFNDANNYAFKTISISGQSDVIADSNTDTLTLAAGGGMSLTTDAANDKITLAHSNSVTAGNFGDTGISRTLAFGGTFTVPYVTYDAQGHLTSKSNLTLTMPVSPDTNTTYTLASNATTGGANLTLVGSDSSNVNIKFAGGTYMNAVSTTGVITLNSTLTASGGINITGGGTITHVNSVVGGLVGDSGTSRTLAFGGTFDIGSVTYDNQGHISAGSTITITMPANPNTDWYPTAFSWTGGTTAGPTGSLTGVGMSAVSYPAIPSAGSSASGIVTTGAQNFAGAKTFDNDVIISGNLTINGSTITVNSTTMTVDDPILTLGGDTVPTSDDAKDRGVEFRWHNGATAKVGFFGFDRSTGKFTFISDATNTSEVFSGTKGSVDAYLNGSDINTGTVGVTYGGTGVNGSTAGNGTLLIGNGTGYTLATLTQGSGIQITNAAGAITIANTYAYTLPLAANGTRGGIQIGYTSDETNRAVLLSSEKAYVTLPRQIPAVTLNGLSSTSPSFYAPTTSGSVNEILISNGSGAPLWSSAGTITVSSINVGTGNVKVSAPAGVSALSGTTTTITTIATANCTGAFFDYVAVQGTNRRIGTIMAIHDGTGNAEYTDISSASLGDTSPLSFSSNVLSSNLQLLATVASGGSYTITLFVRTI